MAAGFVYVLFNPAVPELVKVGRTSNEPDERAEQISSATGTPGRWYVVFYRKFRDSITAERKVHDLLDQRAPRHHKRKELFETPPVVAIDCILEIHAEPEASEPPGSLKNPDTIQNKESLADGLVSDGDNFLKGLNGELEDRKAALDCYEKAAKLGSPSAYERLGRIELGRLIEINRLRLFEIGWDKKNPEKALEYFKEGARLGDATCLLGMAKVYLVEKQQDNGRKCISRYLKQLDDTPAGRKLVNVFCSFLETEMLTGRIESSGPPELARYRDMLMDELARLNTPDGLRSALVIRRLMVPTRSRITTRHGTGSRFVTVLLNALRDLLAEAKSIVAFEEEFGIELVLDSAVSSEGAKTLSFDCFSYPSTVVFRGTTGQFRNAFRLAASRYLRSPGFCDIQDLEEAFRDAHEDLLDNGWSIEIEPATGVIRYKMLRAECRSARK
ncbi:MAG: GIY-YIG nuclease family protein [Deltaproteobacteria bacterium]|nr:GIY-YIG nuclease family protein [Deltaproteobacteria bacterium]